MELENLKAAWTEMNRQIEEQKKMTNKLILKMARKHSRSSLNALVSFEILGMILSGIMALYILLHFNQLDNWLSLTGGIGTILILITGIILSLNFIRGTKKIDVVKNSYRQTVLDVVHLRKTRYHNKLISVFMATLAPFVMIPVIAALLFQKDLLSDMEEYWESLIPGLVLIPVIWYFINRFYTKKLNEVDEVLKDLEQ